EPAHVGERRRRDDGRLRPGLLRDRSTQGLFRHRDRLVRTPEGAVRVRDDVVLILASGDPSVRLRLPKGVPPPFCSVVAEGEDLAHGSGARSRGLGALGLPKRLRCIASGQEGHGPRCSRQRLIGVAWLRGAPDLVGQGTREPNLGGGPVVRASARTRLEPFRHARSSVPTPKKKRTASLEAVLFREVSAATYSPIPSPG